MQEGISKRYIQTPEAIKTIHWTTWKSTFSNMINTFSKIKGRMAHRETIFATQFTEEENCCFLIIVLENSTPLSNCHVPDGILWVHGRNSSFTPPNRPGRPIAASDSPGLPSPYNRDWFHFRPQAGLVRQVLGTCWNWRIQIQPQCIRILISNKPAYGPRLLPCVILTPTLRDGDRVGPNLIFNLQDGNFFHERKKKC